MLVVDRAEGALRNVNAPLLRSWPLVSYLLTMKGGTSQLPVWASWDLRSRTNKIGFPLLRNQFYYCCKTVLMLES